MMKVSFHVISELRTLSASILLTALIFLPCSSVDGKEAGTNRPYVWRLIEIEGVQHVDDEQIAKFYMFRSSEDSEPGVSRLRSPKFLLTIDRPNQWFVANNVKIKPSLPILKGEGGKNLISTTDLAKTLDPTVRPSYIKSDQVGELKLAVVITQEEGLDAPIGSIDPPSDSNARVFLHLKRGKLSIQTDVLSPGEGKTDANSDSEEKSSAWKNFDAINMAIGVASHAGILKMLGAEDLGIHRSAEPPLTEVDVPAARVTVTIPESFNNWGLLSDTVDKSVERLYKAISSQKKDGEPKDTDTE